MALPLPIWALGIGRGAGRALAASITLPIWVFAGALIGATLLFALHGHDRYSAGATKGAERERAAQTKIAESLVRRQARTTGQIERRAEKAQAKIERRYRILREKVRIYVPTETPPGVIRAGDRVPPATVLLLDAAVRGDDPEPISVAAGDTYELGAAIRFDQLVAGYVVNLGIGHQNARQLTDLQDWVRRQQELDAD